MRMLHIVYICYIVYSIMTCQLQNEVMMTEQLSVDVLYPESSKPYLFLIAALAF